MIASGNHLLTQVKGNQKKLRRRLELGAAGRKPGGFAKSETNGRNRWETRELMVFPARAWFRHTAWEPFIKTVLRLERTVCRRDPATGLCKQTTEAVFWVSSVAGPLVQHRFCKFPTGWFCAATRPRRTSPTGDFFGVFFPTSTKESTTWHNA